MALEQIDQNFISSLTFKVEHYKQLTCPQGKLRYRSANLYCSSNTEKARVYWNNDKDDNNSCHPLSITQLPDMLVDPPHLLSLCVYAKSLQSCLTLCNLMDCSPPSSSVHGILQSRTLKWVTMPFSRESSQPRDWTRISYIFCIGRRVLYH